jgi:hypothetical protein
MCRENLQTEMIRNFTDPILKLNETVIEKSRRRDGPVTVRSIAE